MRHLQPEEAADRAGARRQALPLVEDRAAAAVANAVIIYMMDVSGSMGDEQKEIVRIESFWIDTWLRRSTRASRAATSSTTRWRSEVDRDTFFHTRESGGTMISQRLQAVREDHRRRLPARRVEHLPVPLLRRRQLVDRRHAVLRRAARRRRSCPQVNMFCYGQVESPYGSGQFIKDLQRALRRGRERRDAARSGTRTRSWTRIKDFLGKGK